MIHSLLLGEDKTSAKACCGPLCVETCSTDQPLRETPTLKGSL